MSRKILVPFLVWVMIVLLFMNLPAQGIADPQTAVAGKIGLMTRVNRDMSQMAAIYQAMYALLKQAMDQKQVRVRSPMAARKRKLQESRDAIAEKEEQIRNERESAQDNFITACVTSMAKCITSITGSIAGGLGGSLGRSPTSIMLFRKYRRDVKKGLILSRTLGIHIKKLVKDYKRRHYNRNQNQRIRDLLKKLNKLKHELAKAKRRNTNYIKILKTKKN